MPVLFDDEPQSAADDEGGELAEPDYPEILLEPLHVMDRLCLKWGLHGLSIPAPPRDPEPEEEAPPPSPLSDASDSSRTPSGSVPMGPGQPSSSRASVGYLRLLGLLSGGSPWECNIQLSTMARQGGIILGRDPACCEVVLQEPSISRRHVVFEYLNDQVVVTDQNSTNGTYVNGHRLGSYHTRVPLADNSVLTLGDISLRVEIFAANNMYL